MLKNYCDLEIRSYNQLLAIISKLELGGYDTSHVYLRDFEGMTLRLRTCYRYDACGISTTLDHFTITAIFKNETSYEVLGLAECNAEIISCKRFVTLLGHIL